MNKDIDDGLTDEERAALLEDDGAGDDAAAAGVDVEANAAADVEAAAAEQSAADKVAADKTAQDAADAANASKDAETKQEPEDKAAQSAPILIAPAPEDAAAKLADIDTKKEALLTQFDDGDITAREYQKQLDTLAREERAIERAQDRAELAASMESQRLQNDWTTTCNAFVDQHPVYKDNPRLYKALDSEIRDLAAKPETANWTGPKFLEEAHKALKESFGFQEAEPAKQKTAIKEKEFPPNLAKVPAANVEDTSGNRFAVLDRMATSDPMAYEEAISKMPEAERNAYLAA